MYKGETVSVQKIAFLKTPVFETARSLVGWVRKTIEDVYQSFKFNDIHGAKYSAAIFTSAFLFCIWDYTY